MVKCEKTAQSIEVLNNYDINVILSKMSYNVILLFMFEHKKDTNFPKHFFVLKFFLLIYVNTIY